MNVSSKIIHWNKVAFTSNPLGDMLIPFIVIIGIIESVLDNLDISTLFSFSSYATVFGDVSSEIVVLIKTNFPFR